MTLARITNFVNGNILTGPQLNNEFDNIYNNGPSLIDLAIPKTTQVMGLTGSLSASIGSFAALSYALRSTSGVCSVSATSSFSVNTQTPGPLVNGRDQAAAFGSTDVHFYAISTGGTSTVAAGIASSNPPPTGPTLPAGYTAWAYLCSAKYSTASSAVVLVSFVFGSRIYGRTKVVDDGAATTFTAQSISSAVPRLASAVDFLISDTFGLSTGVGTPVEIDFEVSAQSGGTPKISQAYIVVSGSGAGPRGTNLTGTLPLIETTPTLYYRGAITAGTVVGMDLDILAYVVPNGDVG